MTTLTTDQITALAATVTTWHQSRADQGQMIDVSYGRSDEGDIIERTIDRTGPETTYRIVGGPTDAMPVEVE